MLDLAVVIWRSETGPSQDWIVFGGVGLETIEAVGDPALTMLSRLVLARLEPSSRPPRFGDPQTQNSGVEPGQMLLARADSPGRNLPSSAGGRPGPGRLVAVCGVDGAGKSSVLEAIRGNPCLRQAVFLSKRSNENVCAVERLFEDPKDYWTGAFAESIRWAYAFDFLAYYHAIAGPACAAGKTVMSDRWKICAVSYAAAGTGLGHEIADLLHHVPAPDVTVFLEVSPQTASNRLNGRGDRKRNESEQMLAECALTYELWLPRLATPFVSMRNDTLSQTAEQVVRALHTNGILPTHREID